MGGSFLKRFDPDNLFRFGFMRGRYGTDELGRFLAVAGAVGIVLSLLTRGLGLLSTLLSLASLFAVGWCYCRILSKNFARRQVENRSYMIRRQQVIDWYSFRRDCFRQRKDYAFFRCPGCGRTVRVPKGKGKIRITCRHCGFAFEKKT